MIRSRWVGVVLCAIVAQGCGLEGDSSGGSKEPVRTTEPEAELVFKTAQLPNEDGTDCSSAEPQELCDWAAGFDFIALTTIQHAEGVASPATYQDEVLTRCPANTEIGIALALDLESVAPLSGTMPAERVRIQVGYTQNRQWSPSPRLSESGELVFGFEQSRDYFGDGSTLGVAVLSDDSGKYLHLAGEEPFTVDADGNIEAPLHDGCPTSPMQNLRGVHWKTLRERLAACAGTVSSERSAEVREMFQNRPSSGYAAQCFTIYTDDASEGSDVDAGEDAAP